MTHGRGAMHIYWIADGGSSMMTVALLNHLLEEDLVLVDGKMSDPDVWKAYREKGSRREVINLDQAGRALTGLLPRQPAVVLAAPAGRWCFALLLPGAAYNARASWVTASESGPVGSSRRSRRRWSDRRSCPGS
jgi:hypothetical protein